MLLANSHSEEIAFKLAAPKSATGWRLLIDTARGAIEPDEQPAAPGATIQLPARSLSALRRQTLMGARYAFERSWGAELLATGGARFRLWAPALDKVSLVATESKRSEPMRRLDHGWFELATDLVEPAPATRSSSRTACTCRTRRRGLKSVTCTVHRCCSTPVSMTGGPAIGRGALGRRPLSTSFTRAPSPRPAPSPASRKNSTTSSSLA